MVSGPVPITYGQLVAVAAATLISILNYIGIKKAGDFQLVFTFLKVAIILSIVVIGSQLQRRKLAELRGQLYRRQRRHGWVHGCAGGALVGLRRLE